MTHLLAAVCIGLYVTQIAVAPLVRGNTGAARMWLRMAQTTGLVAIALSILTLV